MMKNKLLLVDIDSEKLDAAAAAFVAMPNKNTTHAKICGAISAAPSALLVFAWMERATKKHGLALDETVTTALECGYVFGLISGVLLGANGEEVPELDQPNMPRTKTAARKKRVEKGIDDTQEWWERNVKGAKPKVSRRKKQGK